MEEAPGVKLDDNWENISLEQRITIMKDLVSLEKKMASVSFNRSGNNATLAHVSITNGTLVTAIFTMPAKISQVLPQLKFLVTWQQM
jgi:hypothetical protein